MPLVRAGARARSVGGASATRVEMHMRAALYTTFDGGVSLLLT
jgi:hypothetical protein